MNTEREKQIEYLRLVVHTFSQQMEQLPYARLRQGQKAPVASIPFGTGGLAYAFWRTAAQRADRLAQADRWLFAAGRSSGRTAFHFEDLDDERLGRSCHFSSDGIVWTRLLIGQASGRARRLALHRFLARCLAMLGGPTEFLIGTAGYLYAATQLWQRIGDPRALAAADALARDLLERAARGSRRGWARADGLGFAHGRTGTFHALLAWARAGRDLPAWLLRALDDLTEAAERAGLLDGQAAADNPFAGSWCNGAAGLVLLWARAYELRRDRRDLQAARRASAFLADEVRPASGNLCCGYGGQAYALMAMDRLEPGAGWHEHALERGLRAMVKMSETAHPWPNGLYKGFPGLVCLAQDLLSNRDGRLGFPLADEDFTRIAPLSAG